MNSEELADRLLNFSVRIIRICDALQKTDALRHIKDQLVRAGTSVGANYEEARGAESKADFLHKLNVAVKEMREALYWLKVLQKSGLVKSERLDDIIQEANELCSILVASSKTIKLGKKQEHKE
jgi:four helix bundle protein